jgi:hypothetical protein
MRDMEVSFDLVDQQLARLLAVGKYINVMLLAINGG